MKGLFSEINKIDFPYRIQEQIDLLDKAFNRIADEATAEEKKLLKEDFNVFIERGRFVILNTFAGGIIFLREPEVIEYIKIDFDTASNRLYSSVRYGSENRKERNVKYKPEAGQTESTEGSLSILMPNFFRYNINIQLALMLIIGKIVKKICESHSENSWFMKYEKDFMTSISINGEELITLDVKSYFEDNHDTD